MRATLRGVIGGSFNKFYPLICKLIKEFETLGIEILSPAKSRVRDGSGPFPILESDDGFDIRTIRENYFAAIEAADFFYLCCDATGYLGVDSAIDVGHAIAKHKPVFASAPTTHPGLNPLIKAFATPREIRPWFEKEDKKMSQLIPPEIFERLPSLEEIDEDPFVHAVLGMQGLPYAWFVFGIDPGYNKLYGSFMKPEAPGEFAWFTEEAIQQEAFSKGRLVHCVPVFRTRFSQLIHLMHRCANGHRQPPWSKPLESLYRRDVRSLPRPTNGARKVVAR